MYLFSGNEPLNRLVTQRLESGRLMSRTPLKLFADVFEDGEEVGHRFGTEHGDAGLAEVGDALEDGRGSEMAAGVQDAALLVDTLTSEAPATKPRVGSGRTSTSTRVT